MNARLALHTKGLLIAIRGTTARSPYASGLIDAIPLAIPGVPFGFILGLAIADAPIDGIVGWFGSWFILGGAAQLTMTTLLSEGTTATAAVIAALVVNARHVMYSMAMAARFQAQPRWFRFVGSYALIDQVFALVDIKTYERPREFRHYYLGAATTMVLPWTLWVALGIVVGAEIPESWNLAFAVPVLFLGLLLLGIRSTPGATAAGVAFVTTVALSSLPNRSGLLIGAVLGVLVAATIPLSKGDET